MAERNPQSLLDEARMFALGLSTDTSQWTRTSYGNGKYAVVERSNNAAKSIFTAEGQSLALAFEHRVNKLMCSMCTMYFDKSSMDYRVPQHRVIDCQKVLTDPTPPAPRP